MQPHRNTDVDALVGRVLADRYRLLQPLGAGGMASVYLAEHVMLGKRVAIKILNDDLCRDRSQVDRFLQEARAASMIGHENIVDIIDFGPGPGGSVFYAMEYLEGENLAALLQREGRISWARAREIMIQISRALSAAHEKRVIHRDLKPANCFLVQRADGRPFVKVLDFGIARVTDPEYVDGVLTVPGTVFGTAKYMAPEQACGAPADARTDIYAAAVCLYELITGSVPYDGDNFLRVLNRHITEPLTPPSTRAPDAGISFAVEAVIMKALAKQPGDRYQTMAELQASLSAIGLDGNLVAPPNPGPPRVGPGVARPNGGPTGTIWLGPPQSAVQRTPTMLLVPQSSGHDVGATRWIDSAPTSWAPPPGLTFDVPNVAPPPPTWHHPRDTAFVRARSPLRFAAALLAGGVIAIAAGALAAWLLIGDWLETPDPPSHPRVVHADPEPETAQETSIGALPAPVSPPAPAEAMEHDDPLPADPPPQVEPLLADASQPEREPEPLLADASQPERGAERRARADHRGRTAVNIARGFSRARNRARACMGEASPSRISVRAVLGASGKVLHAEVLDQCDAALASCIRDAVESKARFARTTEPLDVRYWTFGS